ncbi:hypothetical protein yc1106_02203 [Curvularia clavata]|uniref:Xylanolytic transcriptional activator regulatory domain-containing protein n=1 Tax=Curvularia clavata TaxID=95742 RepID=A0A9Q8Z4X6_CURCL|nr:hypothetical protein yc1106_02203 [Curvularia clavata]
MKYSARLAVQAPASNMKLTFILSASTTFLLAAAATDEPSLAEAFKIFKSSDGVMHLGEDRVLEHQIAELLSKYDKNHAFMPGIDGRAVTSDAQLWAIPDTIVAGTPNVKTFKNIRSAEEADKELMFSSKEVSAHPMQQLIHNDLSSGLASEAGLRYAAMDDPAQGPWTADETTQTLPAAAKKFAAFAADIHATMKQMQTRVDLGCSERKIFACLPPKQHTVCLLRPVIEEIQLHGVFLEEEIVLHQLDEQYIAGPDDCDSDPCRWMTVCSLLAVSTLHRTDNRSLTAISSIAWAFFKNAFTMYAELVARRPTIASCEALLAMALFVLRTADAGLTAQLTATAAHMAHMLGLQKQEYYIGLDAEVAERHKRILWAVYILNADVTHRYGLPSPLDEENIVIELPEVEDCHVSSPVDHMARLSRPQRGGILRQQAVFAVAKLRIHKLLERVSLRRLSMQEIIDLLEAVTTIHQELEEWKCFMPTEIQTSSRAYGAPRLEMPVAILHYTYLSCISKISMTEAVLLDLAKCNPDMQEVQPPASNKTFSTSRMARARCAMAARGTLDVLLRLQPQPFTHLW